MSDTPRFDVVIYEIKTRRVESVVGTNLARDSGRINAERRADTVSPRLNDDFNVAIVPTGVYKKNSILNEADF